MQDFLGIVGVFRRYDAGVQSSSWTARIPKITACVIIFAASQSQGSEIAGPGPDLDFGIAEIKQKTAELVALESARLILVHSPRHNASLRLLFSGGCPVLLPNSETVLIVLEWW